MYCPLEKIEITLERCPVVTCMYSKEGVCEYEILKELSSDPERVVARFGEAAVRQAVKRVRLYTYVDRYVQFRTEQGLNQVTKDKLALLALQEEEYESWPEKKLDFTAMSGLLSALAETGTI